MSDGHKYTFHGMGIREKWHDFANDPEFEQVRPGVWKRKVKHAGKASEELADVRGAEEARLQQGKRRKNNKRSLRREEEAQEEG